MNGDKDFWEFFKGLAKFPLLKKKKNQDVKAYFLKNNATDLPVERHRMKIPTIGWVRFKEMGYIPMNATVINCTVSQKAGRYFVSVLCEIEEVKEAYIPEHDGIGIDLGLRTFAVCSYHVQFDNINKTQPVIKLEKNLKRQQRKLSCSYEQN